MIARLSALAIAALLAGCSSEPVAEIYPLPLSQVRTILRDTGLPFPLLGTAHAGVRATPQPDGTIELAIIDSQDRAQLRFSARPTAIEDGKTSVLVTYIGGGKAYPAIDQRAADNPEIIALYLKTIREQVDADLDGRPFNNLAIGREVMAAVSANAASIAQDMKEVGEEYRRRDRANIEKAYAAEARGKWP